MCGFLTSSILSDEVNNYTGVILRIACFDLNCPLLIYMSGFLAQLKLHKLGASCNVPSPKLVQSVLLYGGHAVFFSSTF